MTNQTLQDQTGVRPAILAILNNPVFQIPRNDLYLILWSVNANAGRGNLTAA